jgi:photoactive yellow protein
MLFGAFKGIELMNKAEPLTFGQPGLIEHLDALSDAELDAVAFGVIGFDAESIVRRYGAFESRSSGLALDRVLGRPLFSVVAQCMNNYLVAQRFEDAAAAGVALDVTIDYVLTLRVRPIDVRLRLLAKPGIAMRYVLIERLA